MNRSAVSFSPPGLPALDWASHARLDQLLAVLIGEPAISAVQRAGGLARLLRDRAPAQVDDVTRARLDAFRELALRWFLDRRVPPGVSISSPAAVAGALADLALLDHEEIWVLFLDARHRLLSRERLAAGGPSSVEFRQSLLFRRALLAGASSMILCHNHPSGDPAPSPNDRALTVGISTAATLIDIPLLDHVIIGAGGCTYSFAQAHYGRLDPDTLKLASDAASS
jgi:DNA repair protein RadC